jgi:hypothetical protein
MLINRSNEINRIMQDIKLASKEDCSARITLIHGCFGSGKSAIIEEIERISGEKNYIDCCLKCNDYKEIAFIPDFAYELAKNTVYANSGSGIPEARETEFIHLKFIDNLIRIKEAEFDVFNIILKRVILKSIADSVLESFPSRKSDAQDLDEIYDSFFDKKSDRALMSNIDIYAAEAFIVDIMNYFFPLNIAKPSFEHYLGAKVPKKVLIIIDDVDPIAGSLVNWLFSIFIPYCTKKSFNDFVSFDFEGSKLETKVSDFLDFRLIIASRHDFLSDNIFAEILKYKDEINDIHLKPFDVEQTEQYILAKGLSGEISPGTAMSVTMGIPLVLSLWTDSRSYVANNFDNFILPLVMDKIFKYSAAYEIEWIKSVVFPDYLDSDTLRCFSVFDGNVTKALYFFVHMNGIAIATNDETVSILPEIRKFILKSIELESEELFNELCQYGKIATLQRELMLPFNNHEKRLLNRLSYFFRFDKEFVPEYALGEEATEIIRIINDFPYFFEEIDSNMSFKPEVFNQLVEYNKIADKENYDFRKEEVKKCWDEYLNYLSDKNEELTINSENILHEISNEEVLLKQKKDEYTEHQIKFMREENELIELKVAIADYSINKNLYSSVSYFSIAVILGVVGFFLTDIFAGSPNISSFEIIQYVLFAFAALFAIVGGVFGIRMMGSSSKAEYERLSGHYTKKMSQKEERQTEMMQLRNIIDNAEIKINNLKERHNELTNKLKDNHEKIKVPFYY